MRRLAISTAVVLFLALNGALVYRAWRRPAESGSAPLNPEEAKFQEDAPKREAMANAWIAEWNSSNAIPIMSAELPAAIASLKGGNCLPVQSPGVAVNFKALDNAQVEDLNAAITGFLRAYAAGDAEAVIRYMHDRGKRFDSSRRHFLEKGMKSKGETDFERLSNEELYARAWKVKNGGAHCESLVADCSCRQVWDGMKLPANEVHGFTRHGIDHPDAPAVYLGRIMNGSRSSAHFWAPERGSIDEELRGKLPVLLADVKLVLGYDDEFYDERAPWLVRFWYNRAARKWQPICLEVFAGHPKKSRFPQWLF
ncbi:MAG TPA: hypothetical protein VMV10_27010 [Pirellulales bacterium]|nr:hypothetical protein [Pirellulales bacterium]